MNCKHQDRQAIYSGKCLPIRILIRAPCIEMLDQWWCGEGDPDRTIPYARCGRYDNNCSKS